MRILFTSDLHGQRHLYDQLAELAVVVRPDALILGGDMLPDSGPEEAEAVQAGFFSTVVRDLLVRLRDELGPLRTAMIFGNHEARCAEAAVARLEDEGLLTFLSPNKVAAWGEVSLVGYSCAPPCPYWAKDYERLDRRGDENTFEEGYVWEPDAGEFRRINAVEHLRTLATMEEDLASVGPVERPWILVAHSPPAGVQLDRLACGLEVGSEAVAAFIRQRQPDVSLHGHVHEAPRMTGQYRRQVGRTLVVNPGQGERELAAVHFSMDDPAGTLTACNVACCR